ncbi:hypothetical protein BRADI_1g01075v3 [Brachypodium distachyon]|uniref:Uncharacterized protein n=1 Tax=Brachypodium distachyon TaxID=15368 RepID=A0A2K2DHK6_BRADI|nr:hypothetical protein BRADI_1g01075v3 [Brachypodium distachyon]
MGSVISSAIAAAFPHRDDFLLADEDDPNGGPFFHELPLHQQERLKQRWMEKLERKNPRAVVWGPRSREERIAAELLPLVQIALQHYNSNNPVLIIICFPVSSFDLCNRASSSSLQPNFALLIWTSY